MNRSILATFFVLTCVSLTTLAKTAPETRSSAEIVPTENATHIGRIANDTLVVATGSTFSFTVDSPESQGAVSTKPTAGSLLLQVTSNDGSKQRYQITDKNGTARNGDVTTGDRLVVTSQDGKKRKTYHIVLAPMALSGRLRLLRNEITVNTLQDITLHFTAGQRTPDATVRIFIPAGIKITLDNTTVNVIGRGEFTLRNFSSQSIGRTGVSYPYSKVGDVAITDAAERGSILTFTHLDLRPANGPDLVITIKNISLSRKKDYVFKAVYTTAVPEVLTSGGIGPETAVLTARATITDLERVIDKRFPYTESPDSYTQTTLKWSRGSKTGKISLLYSVDKGKTWDPAPATIDARQSVATISGLAPGKFYMFRLSVKDGERKGFSNPVYFYTGKVDIKTFGVSGDGSTDDTQKINDAIDSLGRLGGGTLLFSKGVYAVRTVHLRSNICLFLEKEATIRALKGGDAPEATWFSDKKYRSGLSPTDPGPYDDPENYLTKQDVGHHYFKNTMFFGERLDNVRIVGNGLISGNGNLVTGDKVMNNALDNRSDKMFTFKLCTNIEIGGLWRDDDLWYDPDKDEPYYRDHSGTRQPDLDNMLHIDRAGHFALLATGTDTIHVHNTYFARHHTSNARDIYDFMGCNTVTVTNIYSKVSSDDIVKLGSDCSLGFTRPARDYRVRNIIGDTNCNLFQIGSETADDIMDVHVDNIFITGANKAGFSISTNDGGHVKDIHLNCGHTGPVHSRSKMLRTTTPFFISISNRGRIIGAQVGRYTFAEGGEKRSELLVKNVSIGKVENIILNGVDISEVYGGSSFGNNNRWKRYDGSQRKATPIVAGYKLPATDAVEGRLDFTLPDGEHTGYITNIRFSDIHVLVKGGNPLSDTQQSPPELGVGQYNVSNLNIQPAYGLWARHVKGLTIKECTFNYEQRDSRYAIVLDDVTGAIIDSTKMVRAADNAHVIRLINSPDVTIQNTLYFNDRWENSPTALPAIHNTLPVSAISLPEKM